MNFDIIKNKSKKVREEKKNSSIKVTFTDKLSMMKKPFHEFQSRYPTRAERR